MVDVHHVCSPCLQALFITASVLRATSTTATRTMAKGRLTGRPRRPHQPAEFRHQNESCSLISIKLRPRRSSLKAGCRGLSGSAPMLAPLFGYFFSMITVLAAAVVLLTSMSHISSIGNGRQRLRPPVIGRTVTVEVQRHLPVAKEEAPAQDVSPGVATAKADTKKNQALQAQSGRSSAQQLRLWERAGICRRISVRPESSLFPLIPDAKFARRFPPPWSAEVRPNCFHHGCQSYWSALNE
jgi:hypothetical protein